MKQYDAIIIGFGKGGKLLAAELANRNWKVAIIERSPQMYGGTCVNVGCIPTKALIYESEQAERLYRDDYGNQAKYYALAIRRKNKLVSFLRDKNHERIKEHPNITLYDGTASFVSDDTVKVVSHNKKEILLKGKEVFINTGATPILPAVKGIDASKHVFTSETLLQQSKLPGHLLILGAGAIGMEFATMYAGFGSKVPKIIRISRIKANQRFFFPGTGSVSFPLASSTKTEDSPQVGTNVSSAITTKVSPSRSTTSLRLSIIRCPLRVFISFTSAP